MDSRTLWKKAALRAAGKEANVVSGSVALAASAALANPLPLLLWGLGSGAWVLFASTSDKYINLIFKEDQARREGEVRARREKMKQEVLPTLRPQLQETYARLEATRQQISEPAAEGQKWLFEVLHKLDYLLEKYLLFAGKELQFRSYLREMLNEVRGIKPQRHSKPGAPAAKHDASARAVGHGPAPSREGMRSVRPPKSENSAFDPADRWVNEAVSEIQRQYDTEIAGVDKAKELEQDASTSAVLDKRREVLDRRKEFIGKMGRILFNLNHQIQLVEDTFGLINDEIRARSPEQILSDIEDVVGQTETMTKLLEEVAPYEHLVERMSA